MTINPAPTNTAPTNPAPTSTDRTPITADVAWTEDTPAFEVFALLGIDPVPLSGLSHVEHIATLRAALHKVAIGSAIHARQKAAANAELEVFRHAVRAKAREVADKQDWCRRGLNETLADLGLDEYPPFFEFTVTVTAQVAVDESDQAYDQDSAAQRVRYAVDGLELSGRMSCRSVHFWSR